MYQWRKFEFFEEKLAGRCTIPEEVREKKIECCSSGRGKVVIGCNDGSVNLLDRGLKFSYGFQAHSSTVSFLQQLKVGNFFFSCFFLRAIWILCCFSVSLVETDANLSNELCVKYFDL